VTKENLKNTGPLRGPVLTCWRWSGNCYR